jgi:hypothetical protein
MPRMFRTPYSLVLAELYGKRRSTGTIKKKSQAMKVRKMASFIG